MLDDDKQRAKALSLAVQVVAKSGYVRPGAYKEKPIDFIDPAPKPFVVQIPLVEYFERVKRLKAARWQRDFCARLQQTLECRHLSEQGRAKELVKLWVEYHAQAQAGKTIILSQTLPAWILGHDPLFRYALAMYNVSRSVSHSQVVIDIMRSPIHKDIFPSADGHLPNSVSKEGWSTNARMDVESGSRDGQMSFNPVGLVSGMTGSGFDWLTVDDPYKEPKDAFSETMYDNLARFWTYGVIPRISPTTCIAAMFHRYNYDDFGGYLLNTGKFDYVRYASECDGDYIHEETGQRFSDPLDRQLGELLSPERFPESYYRDKRGDGKVWLSMFQGRPGREEGDFFQVGKIEVIHDELQSSAAWAQCLLRARGWDHAATQGAGDNSAGAWAGLGADGTCIVADIFSAQLDTARRVEKQRSLAEADGLDTTVVVPEGVSADGKDNVFMMRQNLEGFNVVARKVTNAAPGSDAKKRRAYNLSVAVNSGKVKFLGGDWVERMKLRMRRFGNAVSGDDEIDALADAYNYLYEEFHKGLVIKALPVPQAWEAFTFGPKIPAHWTVYVGVKITPESNAANSAVIVARAAENSGLKDELFIVDEYKEYTADFYKLFAWVDDTLATRCAKPESTNIYLHPDSEDYLPTIRQKLAYSVTLFEESAAAGIAEANWYCQNGKLKGLGELPNVKQEAATWGFNDKGEPTKIGQAWDCLRMICYRFRTWETSLTPVERMNKEIQESMPTYLAQPESELDAQRKNLYLQQQLSDRARQAEAARNSKLSGGVGLGRRLGSLPRG